VTSYVLSDDISTQLFDVWSDNVQPEPVSSIIPAIFVGFFLG